MKIKKRYMNGHGEESFLCLFVSPAMRERRILPESSVKGVIRMDSVDRSILEYLSENSRQSATAISQKVHLSVAAVIERIKKLESRGVIQQYTVIADQHKIGNDVTALMEVSLEHPKYYEGFAKAVHANPSIAACYYLTGDCDFIIKIYTRSSETLEQLHQAVKSIQGVASTKTYFVLKEIKREQAVPAGA